MYDMALPDKERLHCRLIGAAHKLASATLGEWSPAQQAEWERLQHEVGDMLAAMAKGSPPHDDDGSEMRGVVKPRTQSRC
jgi:hypothetical protein